MLGIMLVSGVAVLLDMLHAMRRGDYSHSGAPESAIRESSVTRAKHLDASESANGRNARLASLRAVTHDHHDAWRFALPQVLLAVLCTTNFHVQIITRLASGYFLPYIWLTRVLESGESVKLFGKPVDVAQVTVRWMIMYAVVQGGLYASFLPPA